MDRPYLLGKPSNQRLDQLHLWKIDTFQLGME
jgi:hypothetical protein